MSKETLEQLYAEHQGKGSDKWSIYLREYGRIFNEYREKPIKLLEIGVQNGGSLEIWSRFFKEARCLIGCDINPDCANLQYEDPRISVIVGDANSDEAQAAILARSSTFDIILDDGSHRSGDIVRSFGRYFPYLADDGIFVIEDLHCSYWREFEGGLFDPFSSITFFKRLADIVNHEHWGIARSRSAILQGFVDKYGQQINDEMLAHVHSVEFINSMCVVRKQAPGNNKLGRRFFSGMDESIVSGEEARRLESWSPPDQTTNPMTARELPLDEEAERLLGEMAIRDEKIMSLQASLIDLQASLIEHKQQMATALMDRDAIFASVSWRITKPLRLIAYQAKRVRNILGV